MIILRFNNVCTARTCFLSENEFTEDVPLAFYWEGDYNTPVDPKIAIKERFTISQDDFDSIKELILTEGKGFNNRLDQNEIGNHAEVMSSSK